MYLFSAKQKGRSEFASGAIRLTNDSALVTVHGTPRTSDVFLNNVEGDHRRREIRAVDEFPDPEQDLPRHQRRKEGRRESYTSVVGEEPLDAVAEGSVGEGGVGGGKSEKVIEIGAYSPLHPLRRPLVDHHHEAKWELAGRNNNDVE